MTYTPTLIIPRRVFKEIIEESLQHPATETGAALIGVESKDLIVVVATLRDLVNIERSPGLFKNGGEYQKQLFRWYRKHWDMDRKRSRQQDRQSPPIHWTPSIQLPNGYVPPELDLELAFLGDWHKHPGNMTELSGTDLATIRRILSDPTEKRNQLLSPIVTFYQGGNMGRRIEVARNKVIVSGGDNFNIDWYYTGRYERTTEINPFMVASDHVPSVPPLPWHLKEPQRLDNELMYLGMRGYETTWRVADIDGDSICEMVFAVDSPNWSKQVIVSTSWDYPKTHATIYVLDKVHPQEQVLDEEAVQEEVPEVMEPVEPTGEGEELMQPVEETVAAPQTEPEFEQMVQVQRPSLFSQIKSRIKRPARKSEVQETLRLPKWDNEVHIADLIAKIEDQLI